jgi:hypothetical protein
VRELVERRSAQILKEIRHVGIGKFRSKLVKVYRDGSFGRGRCDTTLKVGVSILTLVQAENADEWSYQKGLEGETLLIPKRTCLMLSDAPSQGGWIPRDPTDRLYPDICSRR